MVKTLSDVRVEKTDKGIVVHFEGERFKKMADKFETGNLSGLCGSLMGTGARCGCGAQAGCC